MKRSLVIKNAVAFAKERLDSETSGHDWYHIDRVRNMARHICKTEKADQFIIDLALILHDVGDRKILKTNEDDYSIAESFLLSQNISEDVADNVMFIIKNISFRHSNRTKLQKASIEFYIAQDADRLDALGAIGIARVFAFGGSLQRKLFVPHTRRHDLTTENYGAFETSSVQHFYEKLLLLKELMNTRTGKKIANKRHRFMEKYLKEFFLEWEGKL